MVLRKMALKNNLKSDIVTKSEQDPHELEEVVKNI